ncbi:MAG: aminotransferase class IV [Microthrixaceae bacterium]|nr:aminotransferase class IV [Microthrixaceae bacterium]
MSDSPTYASGSPSGAQYVVWIDGGPAGADTAGIHWSDHGFTVGDGVFETIKSVDGRPFALEAHLDRLERSAAGLALTLPPRTTLTAAVHDVARRFHHGHGPGTIARVRLTVTAGPGPAGSERGTTGPTLLATACAMTLSREPTGVVVAPWTRNENGALRGCQVDQLRRERGGTGTCKGTGRVEAIFANTRGGAV